MAEGVCPKYSAAMSSHPNSPSPNASQRNCGSISAASFCTAGRKSPSADSKRNSTDEALILLRLPDIDSTCSEVPMSDSTCATLKPPSSSK